MDEAVEEELEQKQKNLGGNDSGEEKGIPDPTP